VSKTAMQKRHEQDALKSVDAAGADSVGIQPASEQEYIDNFDNPKEGDEAAENGGVALQFAGDSFGFWVAHGL